MGYKGDMKKAVKADLVEKYLKVFHETHDKAE